MIQAIIERCAGIDVGKKFLAVCVMTGPAQEEPYVEGRKFGTVREQLVALRQWLQSQGCTHVVMESTGCYWKPVLNVLEDDAEYRVRVILANPQQVKGLTGHKTDPHDARWLAHLLRHGMIRPSFIPPRALRDLRDFTRRRKQMIEAASQERNRVQKLLEDANVKIGDVLSDVFGMSGQLMLEALVEGVLTHIEMAQLAQRTARRKIADLEKALEGHQMRAVHRSLIGHCMSHMAFLAREVESLDADIGALIEQEHLSGAYELLQTLPGIRETAAATILAEAGPNMEQFPGEANFSSWAGVAPGNNESAGVRKKAPVVRGNPHLKAALVEAGWSATRTKGCEFRDRYERQKLRLGHKRALVSAAHLLAIRIYRVLATGQPYESPDRQLSPRKLQSLRRHHSRRLTCIDHWLREAQA